MALSACSPFIGFQGTTHRYRRSCSAQIAFGKTFASSDLDETYYYRNLAEYERDREMNAVRAAYREAYAAEDAKKAAPLVDAIYADPPAAPPVA